MNIITHTKLKANGRIWIDTDEGAFLGYGRIEILERIKESGSIIYHILTIRFIAILVKVNVELPNNLIKEKAISITRVLLN